MKLLMSFLLLLLSACFAVDPNGLASITESKLEVTTSKMNSGNYIFKSSDDSNDCSYYLINIPGGWTPSTFVHNGNVYFHIPCKLGDAGSQGWHYGIAYWVPGNSSVIWQDGDSGQVGDQAQFLITDLDKNGYQVSYSKFTETVDVNGKQKGMILKYYRASNYGGTNGYYWSPVSFDSPATYSATDIDADYRGGLNYSNKDGSFKGLSLAHLDLVYDNSVYYAYLTTRNDPDKDTYYITLRKSTDLLTWTDPDEYLLKDYRDPHVFKYSDKYYMIAMNILTNKWQLIPAKTLENFDTKNAINLDIGNQMYGQGDWDDTPKYTPYPDYQPAIAGVEVINSTVYLFYLAGSFGQLTTDTNSLSPNDGAPYNGARGIGVMEIEIK
ncbi:MAG: hypothetical protein CL674_00720 [Bdellovibrionaceae bacterium]|nr:hypothetical protein [Pseudobdellovibrionaceae bacterium]|tara:strand:+ start:9504 stop:10649 length:1146 start_codon:yes stop_codon:yes gene_type:complete